MFTKIFSKKTDSKREQKPNDLPPDAFQTAMQQHQMGNFAEADALYRQILQQQPNHADALHFFGVLAYQLGQNEAAVELISQAIRVYPTSSPMYCNLGLALQALGKFDAAAENYQKAVALRPDDTEAHFNLGNIFQTQGKLNKAVDNYRKVLSLQPDYVEAHNNLGNVFVAQNKVDAAIESYRQVLSLKPDYAEVHNNLGCLLKAQGKLDEAIESFQQLLVLKPDDAAGYYNLGIALQEQNSIDAAIDNYQQAISLKPDYAVAYYNLAMALKDQGKLEAAIENFQTAISLKPDYADAYNNLGTALQEQGKLAEAVKTYQLALVFKPDCALIHNNLGIALLAQDNFSAALKSYQQAILINPDYAEAHYGVGAVFQAQSKLDEAIKCFHHAISLKPDYADAYYSVGNILHRQRKLDIAIESYQKALILKPDDAKASSMLFYTQLHCCDWSVYTDSRLEMITAINKGTEGYDPFAVLSISESVSTQQQCASNYTDNQLLPETAIVTNQRYQHDKIRIAYISGDFREHPMTFLMAGLFEQHNQQQFEIIAISLNPEDKSPTGQRIKNAFRQFIDVSRMANYEVALLMRKLEIDIAVDLMGFTGNARFGIFTQHPAPIQVNYLGYPATMGKNYIDYIFADAYLISPQSQQYYTEKVAYLPDCFQANDDKRTISPHKPTRAQVGLPESGFVFCAFNNSYKINPAFFDVWMRLLKSTPKSVLWLVTDNLIVPNNLRNEAAKHGVNPERLVFANRMHYPDHLARFQLADLFLDTLPFNAGTTASDALWAGVPVITCSGEAFAARMAGSLLNAIGLPELITHSLEDYEKLAFKLATTPDLLAEIRAKLAKNRNTYPLFNTDRFRRHIESAYISMWERYQRGELPASFSVQPIE